MRWCVGVGMGFRQGETLGLRWPYVDFENELFNPKWQLQRLTRRHGCADPHACRVRLHRFEPCPSGCATHKGCKRGRPKPCRKDCTGHARTCPDRKDGGLVFTRPKTKKSQKPVPIAPPFIPCLIEHKAQQEQMPAAAGDGGGVTPRRLFPPRRTPYRPASGRRGVQGIPGGGSRHTAGTILNELGVDMPTIMEILRLPRSVRHGGT